MPPEAPGGAAELRPRVRRLLDANWRAEGYTAPSLERYPWQWLWDSCFSAVVWAELGDERGLVELTTLLARQDEDGFVPHVVLHGEPGAQAEFWGRRGTSSITQPPMYGHALAELARRGIDPPDELVERAGRGVRFLLGRPRIEGLVVAAHPWETGADDSPRWDHWCPEGFSADTWYRRKGELMAAIRRTSSGAPVDNPDFHAAPAGLSALVAYNALELAQLSADDHLAEEGRALVEALRGRWQADLSTWRDAGDHADGSGSVRTLDGLLPALVVEDDSAPAALVQLSDERAFGAPYGPTGVHRDEPSYEPRRYWRGPAWPQLGYLMWLAARRLGRHDEAATVASGTVRGAVASGLAEYWDPDSGDGLGAVPHAWAGLAVVVDADRVARGG